MEQDDSYTDTAGVNTSVMSQGEAIFALEVTDPAVFDGNLLENMEQPERDEFARVVQMNRSGLNVLHLFLVRELAGAGVLGKAFPGMGKHPLEGQHHLVFPDEFLINNEDLFTVPAAVVDDQENNLSYAGMVAAHEMGHHFTLRHPDQPTTSPLLFHLDGRNLMIRGGGLWDKEDLLERQAELARQSVYLPGN